MDFVSERSSEDEEILASDSDSEEQLSNEEDGKILNGVVAYVEVRQGYEDRSRGVIEELTSMGATISKTLTKQVTHVIYRQGRQKTYDWAFSKSLPILTVSWILECRRKGYRVAENLHLFKGPFDDNKKLDSPFALLGNKKRRVHKFMNPLPDSEEIKMSIERLKRKRQKNAKREALEQKAAETAEALNNLDTDFHRPNLYIPKTPPLARARLDDPNKYDYKASLSDGSITTSPAPRVNLIKQSLEDALISSQLTTKKRLTNQGFDLIVPESPEESNRENGDLNSSSPIDGSPIFNQRNTESRKIKNSNLTLKKTLSSTVTDEDGSESHNLGHTINNISTIPSTSVADKTKNDNSNTTFKFRKLLSRFNEKTDILDCSPTLDTPSPVIDVSALPGRSVVAKKSKGTKQLGMGRGSKRSFKTSAQLEGIHEDSSPSQTVNIPQSQSSNQDHQSPLPIPNKRKSFSRRSLKQTSPWLSRTLEVVEDVNVNPDTHNKTTVITDITESELVTKQDKKNNLLLKNTRRSLKTAYTTASNSCDSNNSKKDSKSEKNSLVVNSDVHTDFPSEPNVYLSLKQPDQSLAIMKSNEPDTLSHIKKPVRIAARYRRKTSGIFETDTDNNNDSSISQKQAEGSTILKQQVNRKRKASLQSTTSSSSEKEKQNLLQPQIEKKRVSKNKKLKDSTNFNTLDEILQNIQTSSFDKDDLDLVKHVDNVSSNDSKDVLINDNKTKNGRCSNTRLAKKEKSVSKAGLKRTNSVDYDHAVPRTILDIESPQTASNNNKSTLHIPPQKERDNIRIVDSSSTIANRKVKTNIVRQSLADFDLPIISFTSLHKTEQEELAEVVLKLGNYSLQNSVTNRTHVLVTRTPLRRTLAFLKAFVLSIPIVSYEWVKESLKKGRWLPVQDFLVDVSSLELSSQASSAHSSVSPCNRRKLTDLFHDMAEMYVAPNVNPPARELSDLIRLAGGRVTTSHRSAGICVGTSRQTAVCVSPSWILESITHGSVLDPAEFPIPSPKKTD